MYRKIKKLNEKEISKNDVKHDFYISNRLYSIHYINQWNLDGKINIFRKKIKKNRKNIPQF